MDAEEIRNASRLSLSLSLRKKMKNRRHYYSPSPLHSGRRRRLSVLLQSSLSPPRRRRRRRRRSRRGMAPRRRGDEEEGEGLLFPAITANNAPPHALRALWPRRRGHGRGSGARPPFRAHGQTDVEGSGGLRGGGGARGGRGAAPREAGGEAKRTGGWGRRPSAALRRFCLFALEDAPPGRGRAPGPEIRAARGAEVGSGGRRLHRDARRRRRGPEGSPGGLSPF